MAHVGVGMSKYWKIGRFGPSLYMRMLTWHRRRCYRRTRGTPHGLCEQESNTVSTVRDGVVLSIWPLKVVWNSALGLLAWVRQFAGIWDNCRYKALKKTSTADTSHTLSPLVKW